MKTYTIKLEKPYTDALELACTKTKRNPEDILALMVMSEIHDVIKFVAKAHNLNDGLIPSPFSKS